MRFIRIQFQITLSYNHDDDEVINYIAHLFHIVYILGTVHSTYVITLMHEVLIDMTIVDYYKVCSIELSDG